MKFPVQFVVLSILCLATEIDLSEASYECGIRKHGLRPMIHRGWQTEKGSWPWHVGLFHRNTTGQFEYACGGTLVNEWHVLTAAHCVVKRKATKSLPAIMYEIELHLGQHNLSITEGVVIRDVKKAVVHPEYTTHRNDIAVLVLRLKVEYSEPVIPICLDRNVDRDLRDLEGRRGWVTGWGNTENETISEVLRTLSLPVASYINCLKDDRLLFGNVLDENVFCAGNLNGSSPSLGDSGGGLFFSDGDRWVLRGIVSTGKMVNTTEGIDTNKYIVFVNVQRYLAWIEEIFAESDPPRIRKQKRISEIECERFQSLTAKRPNGECFNNRYPHHVMVVSPDGDLLGNGVLVNEHNVLTSCSCIRDDGQFQYHPAKVRIEGYGDVAVTEMFCHPNFSISVNDQNYHDLAILKLDSAGNEIELRQDLIPACLANNWTENLYDVLQKTSFDKMRNMNTTMLVEADYSGLLSTETCRKSLDEPLTDGILCFLEKDSYYSQETTADGGVLQSPNRRSCLYTIVGLETENNLDSEDDNSFFSFHTRISHHVDWIEQAVWNEKSVDIDAICGPEDEGYNTWPWSVAIYHWHSDDRSFVVSCSGTLISLKHIVTSAECIVNRTTRRSLPEDTFELHAGQNFLEQRDVNEQIRYVSEVHIHPEDPIHNIGILVASWPFRSTIYLSPICIEDPSENLFSWDSQEMLPHISLWEMFEPGKAGDDRIMEVLERQQCCEASQLLRGEPLASNMLCYVFDYGDQIEIMNDLGNGLGVYAQPVGTWDDDAWHLVGIVSSIAQGNGTSYYVLFVNLQPYIAWIEEIVSQSEPRTEERPKRISEKECDRFSCLYSKVDGVCENAGDLNHIVLLLDDEHKFVCSGVLVRDNRVLTSCECISDKYRYRPTKVQINTYGVVDILKMICHPDYDSTNHHNDVAALHLVNPVELSSWLIPACLANTRTENLTQTVLYSTFVTTSDGRNPRLASRYDVIGTNKSCHNILSYIDGYFKVSDVVDVRNPSQFCFINFWLYEGRLRKIRAVDIDRIQGGYVIQSDNIVTCQFTVIGRGNNMGFEADTYALVETASRIAYYLDWIEQVVWEEEFSSAPQQNWTLVTKGASSATGRRYRDGLMMLMSIIALAAFVWKTKEHVN